MPCKEIFYLYHDIDRIKKRFKVYPTVLRIIKEFIDKYHGHFLVRDICLNLLDTILLHYRDEAIRIFNEIK
jgi:hypothetical protein